MKLSDIDQNLEESPVGLLGRAATKLKKHTPFNKKARAKATARDAVEIAANELALDWARYVGQADIDEKAITPQQLIKFLEETGYLKTGQKVVADKVKDKEHDRKLKAWKKTYRAGDTSNPAPQRESFEARLALMLVEDEDEGPITFNTKEVEKMLLTIVKQVAAENPEGLMKRVTDQPEMVDIDTDGSVVSGDESKDKIASLDQLEAAWDEIAANINTSDAGKEILKVAFDNAVKQIKAGRVK